jgi:hypothetical protein
METKKHESGDHHETHERHESFRSEGGMNSRKDAANGRLRRFAATAALPWR